MLVPGLFMKTMRVHFRDVCEKDLKQDDQRLDYSQCDIQPLLFESLFESGIILIRDRFNFFQIKCDY